MFIKKSLHPLLPKQYNFGKRRDSFRKTLSLLKDRDAKTLVETGSARYGLDQTKSDGASTLVFGAWAHQNDATLYSIDYDTQALAMAKKAALSLEIHDSIEFINAESTAYLGNFSQSVDFLYLDSFDYDKKDPQEQKKCQEHHLWEFRSAQNQLHDDSLVLIDDCKLKGGGKGRMVIDLMKQRGWKVVYNGYQVLLSK